MPITPPPFNVNSSGWTPYVILKDCYKITVCEVNQAGTVDYLVAFPTSADGPRARPAGKEFTFNPGWPLIKGSTPFYIKTVTGSVNFDADEQ